MGAGVRGGRMKCWCCQERIDEPAVLDEHTALPICLDCWSRIPPGQQADIAIRLRDRGHDVLAVNDLIGLLDQALRKALDSHVDWLDPRSN